MLFCEAPDYIFRDTRKAEPSIVKEVLHSHVFCKIAK